MPATIFSNNPSTTTTSTSGTTAPAALSTETWTVTSSAEFPAASNSVIPKTQFTIADPALPAELIYVTNVSGTSWSVTRGVEGTTPVAHATGATFFQIVSAGDLTGMKQAVGAITTPVNVQGTATETLVCEYQPFTGEIEAGTTFEMVATGSIKLTSAPTITWNIRWGWVSAGSPGTSILTLVTGTNCTALASSMSVARPFDVNGTITFIDTTHAIANINFWFSINGTTTIGQGVNSNAASVVISGSGPLALTATWSTTSTQNSLAVPAPLVYRAA